MRICSIIILYKPGSNNTLPLPFNITLPSERTSAPENNAALLCVIITTLTTLTFEKQNSEELNQKLIAEYNQRVAEIPNPITYTRDCYSAIEKARALYLNMGVDLRPP